MTVGKESELLEAGACDQRYDALRAHSELVFAYLEEAMSQQISKKAPRLERARLQELRKMLHEICERMAALNFPDTVVHGDLNFGNILTRSGHCQFIDWCETYVGNPLITLQHLLLLNHQSDPQRKKYTDEVLTKTFRSRMLKICDSAAIDQGMVYMPFLAAASALYGRVEWLTRSSRSDPRRQSYARTLARHMDRAARVPALQDLLAT
jgi:thiamine kinase-like enzyme